MSQQKVAFRRIRGRIVPIRLTQAQREGKAKLGAAEVAGGTAVGYVAGLKKGRWVEAAAQAENEARIIATKAAEAIKKTGPKIRPEQMAFGFKQAIQPKGAVGMAQSLARAQKYSKYAKISKIAGFAIAGALVTRGVTNLVEAATGKEANEPAKFALDVGGGLATLGFQTGFLRRVGAAKSFTQAINAAIRSKKVQTAFKFKRKG